MASEQTEAAPPPATLSPQERRAIRIIPYIVGCALFMQMLDSTVVATALPTMALSLDTSVIRMNTIITSYLLAVAVFVPISGWAADRFGARKVFLAAILLFTASSVACALSQTLTQLIISRVVQGMAGAMMVPVGRIILLRRVPKDQLLSAMAVLTLPALLGPIIGPPVGGFLVTYASWHWIFLINIPVGALGIALVLRYIREDYPTDRPPLDWLGFILSAICLATLVTSFENVGHGTLNWSTLGWLTLAGLIAGLWYVWHARQVAYPIIDLSLLRTKTFAISVLGGNLCRFSLGASPFLLAIMLQTNFGMSALAAGLITFTGAIGALGMKLVAPPIIRRFGFRNVLIINAWLTGLFIALCALFQATTPMWLMIAVLTAGGFFRSLQFTAVNTLTYADLESEAMSQASSFAAMAQQLAISLGVACAAVTLNISMALRGASSVQTQDTIWAFLILGAITALSSLSFARLSPTDGDSLQQAPRTTRKTKA
ncbi:DHA2 family efflux MFS transporter permease subunit [Alcaligenes ammonioxydans]|jgi:EmrB/QacA subfamily drug resistance transporter|uniref:DHA2 family efflux MFS transporter permease subunit n=1 Tax=Alcaligenes ammonioxydans TaxID=2582914 RepID=A0ABX8SVV3_9BURK|nr:DHA2 family efflux MFS transporter permease subunit [Alcaligenes ammonioxydans]EJC62945.1 transporter [Alcaligenes faecalis subsp. faecalis NCIB 8687]QBH19069.1 DHA2 family efflux MFS transporter permease subunit [Alcaligenes faecalis]MCH1880396.1 DHA2 family efflux MFS transporter permease subunit [Alcaligenes ammonioxydans]QXX80177.1 DHA2 family efflux MFS transporter permease subunit [Alcaligenes ammonioxydans]WGQ35151.1 DHA2 family efflux MFS transporter permease subunit [Alcaligenes fa